MKIYISIPITGRQVSKVKAEAARIAGELNAAGHEAVNPFEVSPEEGKAYSYYMGRDIEALLECDAVYMAPGWRESKGCQLEHSTAEIYSIPIYDGVMPPSPFEKARELYGEAYEVFCADRQNRICKAVMGTLEKIFGEKIKRGR